MWWTEWMYPCYHSTQRHTGVSFSISVWQWDAKFSHLLFTDPLTSKLLTRLLMLTRYSCRRVSCPVHRLWYSYTHAVRNYALYKIATVHRFFFTCIAHRHYQRLCRHSFLQVVKYDKRWEHFRADVCLFYGCKWGG